MTPEQLTRLRLLLASGAPVAPSQAFPEVTQKDIAEALDGVDVCFRDFGVGALTVRELGEPDGSGFTAIVEAAATVEVADRAGDIVRVRPSSKPVKVWNPMSGEAEVTPGGFRTENFMRAGGPVLWAHNRDEQLPPVGQVTKSKITKVVVPDSFGGGRRDAVVQTLGVRPDEDLPVSLTVARLAGIGALKTFSVGFARIHADFVKDPKERKKKGLGEMGIHFLTSDQAELSFTPTPMNPLAVTLGMKAAGEDLVARDVERGLHRLQRDGLLTRAEHDTLHELLLPMSGDARAEAKVGAFVEFSAHVRRTGLWPVFDDATPEERQSAASAVEVRAVTPDEEAEEAPEGDEAEGATEGTPPEVEVREAAAEDAEEPEAAEPPAPEDDDPSELEEQVAGLQRQLEAERAVSSSLREELSRAREETVKALKAAEDARNAGGVLSAAEFELLWAAYETVTGVEGTISKLIEAVGARAGLSGEGVDPAGGSATLTGDVAKAMGEVLDRLLTERGITAGGAPAPRPGPPRPAPGDSQDVGADGAAVVRTARQLVERSYQRTP